MNGLFHVPKMPKRGNVTKMIQLLESTFGSDAISIAASVLDAHGTDESLHPTVRPDVVFFPKSTDQVSEAMKIAKSCQSPVIPFGVGTSLEGHIAALQGGLSIDMATHMNKVLEINEQDMDCRVQAGCTRVALNDILKNSGLFFPTDPGANATLGGMASTRASGTNAVRYGTMRNNVLGLTCVLEDGRVIKTGSRARKSSAGMDLTAMFVGAEGTLGCITEVSLRLYGQPEVVASAVVSFESVEGAVATVTQSLMMGVPLARAELLDAKTINAVRARSDIESLSFQDRPCLFLEYHGTQSSVTEQQATVHEVASEHGIIGDMLFAIKPEDRARLWKARHETLYAIQALKVGSRCLITDVCVPISNLAKCLTETIADVEESKVLGLAFGHVGDGNFHVLMPVIPTEPEAYLASVHGVNERLVRRALYYGGTCTGEHGIGYGKAHWLEAEHGPEAVAVMKAIKQALDPDNRMNPGKW